MSTWLLEWLTVCFSVFLEFWLALLDTQYIWSVGYTIIHCSMFLVFW